MGIELSYKNLILLSFEFFLTLGGTLICCASAQYATDWYILQRIVEPPSIFVDNLIYKEIEGKNRVETILYVSSVGALAGVVGMLSILIVAFSFGSTLGSIIPPSFLNANTPFIKFIQIMGFATYISLSFSMGQWAQWYCDQWEVVDDDSSRFLNTVSRDFLYLVGIGASVGCLAILYGMGDCIRYLKNLGLAAGTGLVASAVLLFSLSWHTSNHTADLKFNDDGLYDRRFLGIEIATILSIVCCSIAIIIQNIETFLLTMYVFGKSSSHQETTTTTSQSQSTTSLDTSSCAHALCTSPSSSSKPSASPWCLEPWVYRSRRTRLPEMFLFLGIAFVSISFGIFYYENDQNGTYSDDDSVTIHSVRRYYQLCFSGGAVNMFFVLLLLGVKREKEEVVETDQASLVRTFKEEEQEDEEEDTRRPVRSKKEGTGPYTPPLVSFHQLLSPFGDSSESELPL